MSKLYYIAHYIHIAEAASLTAFLGWLMYNTEYFAPGELDRRRNFLLSNVPAVKIK
ncbi:MAG: hypothetical protein IJG36_08885 [Synergistaceae bacterium]|nr:hypothetical protein [Synergistaceae bacterium]